MTAADQRAPRSDPRIGLVLEGRYRIVRKLGDGGMGSVYVAEHLRVKRQVAVKLLHAHLAERADIVARFHREAEAAASIGHPNIIEVLDMGTHPDGTAFLVLELLEGSDFSRHIAQQGPQPLAKTVHILSQVCDALSAAHAAGIVHRDLKPENIFLIERHKDPWFVKLLDFGISKLQGNGAERSLTATGTALGTPYYMSPEQCQGSRYIDLRSDIYSLGVVLFQALTGQHPFDDESYPMLVLKICTEPPPPLARMRPDLPPELSAVVDRMLAKKPEDRFSSCAEVRAALEPFRDVADRPETAMYAPRTADLAASVLSSSGPRARATVPAYGAPASSDTEPGLAGEAGALPAFTTPESLVSAESPATGSARTPPLLAVLAAVVALAGMLTGAAVAFLAPHDDDAVVDGRGQPPAHAGPASGGDDDPPARASAGDEGSSRPGVVPASALSQGDAPPEPGDGREGVDAPGGERSIAVAADGEPAQGAGSDAQDPRPARPIEGAPPTHAAEPTSALSATDEPARADEDAPATDEDGQVAGRATLRVVAIPYGEIFIDGRRVGANDIRRQVSAGTHSIRVQAPGRSISRRITLRPGQHETVTLRAR